MKLSVDRNKLIAMMNTAFAPGHGYRMGAKPKLGSDAATWKAADCSGYIRWLLYGCSHLQTDPPKLVVLPEGSWDQHEWFRSKGFVPCAYAECGYMDNVLRIAFIPPTAKHPGHVWLVINQQTIESYGGHGPGRRPWDTRVLKAEVSACYVLTDRLP